MAIIKVLIVDNSALFRHLLTASLEENPEIEVVGIAREPRVARRKIRQFNPDVLLLDVIMPRMDGVSFLAWLMEEHPMPVVMTYSLVDDEASIKRKATELGVAEFIQKPAQDIVRSFLQCKEEVVNKVKAAARGKVNLRFKSSKLRFFDAEFNLDVDTLTKKRRVPDAVIAIGASTGGTEAIKRVLRDLPSNTPAIVVSQHIPVAFSASFARSANSVTKMQVKEAEEGDKLLPGHVYIAPGNRHLLVEKCAGDYVCHLDDGPLVNRHKPSVDMMFHSVARSVGANAVGVILTGMGDDGALGLKAMRNAGAQTIAQDEVSSVVWGMPGEAYRLGGAMQLLDLKDIASILMRLHVKIGHKDASQEVVLA